MDYHIARPRRTLYPFLNHQTAHPHTMRRICQPISRHPSSHTSRILPQVYSPQLVVAIDIRPYKHVQIVRRLIAVGSAPSRYPVAASLHKFNCSNNNRFKPHSCHSRRALRRGTLRWATPQDIRRCYRASRRVTPRTAHVLSILAFAVRMGSITRHSRVMALDISIVPMAILEVGVCLALRRIDGGTYIATGTERGAIFFFSRLVDVHTLGCLMLVVSLVLVTSLKAEGFPWRLARIFIGLVYHVLFVQYHRFYTDG